MRQMMWMLHNVAAISQTRPLLSQLSTMVSNLTPYFAYIHLLFVSSKHKAVLLGSNAAICYTVLAARPNKVAHV